MKPEVAEFIESNKRTFRGVSAGDYLDLEDVHKLVEMLENEYSHDDVTHALAYGYKGAKSQLTHAETLKRYKETNMNKK